MSVQVAIFFIENQKIVIKTKGRKKKKEKDRPTRDVCRYPSSG